MNKARLKRRIKFIFNPLFSGFKNDATKAKKTYAKASKKPILKNTIFLEAYLGESITGNVFALFNEMYNNPRFKNYNFIWSVKHKDSMSSEYNNVKYVVRGSSEYINYLARSEYLITDTTFPFYFNKRKEQKFIMSWHGTPYKTLGRDIISATKDAHKNVMKNILHTDYFISPSKYTTDTILESQNAKDLFSGEVLEVGMPRVDLSYNTDASALKTQMNIPQDKKVVLYAPTWNDFEKMEVNVLNLVNNAERLSQLLGDEYLVALKVHYLEYEAIKHMNTNCYLVDNNIDTNKVLKVTDYLITDYSSIFFDFLPLKKPIFFFFTNYEEYSKRRGLYLKREDLPGPTCNSIDQLSEQIKLSSETLNNKYLSAINRFAPYDDGLASKRAINYIFFNEQPEIGKIYKTETNKEKIIFYSGYFKKNGITESFIRLTNNFDYEKYSLSVIVPSKVPKNSEVERTLERLNPNINLIFPVERLNLTTWEQYKYKLFMNRGLNGIVKRLSPQYIMKNEYNRLVGNVKFDKAIDFSGYNAYFGSILGFSDVKEKIVFLHSDMKKDKARIVKGKRPNWLPLQLMFSIYHYFDKIISVSETSHQANVANLGTKLGITDKMNYVGNVLGAERIKTLSEKYNEINMNNEIFLTDSFELKGDVFNIKGIKKPSKNNVNFITLGRLSPEKNHVLLIRSFKLVLDKIPNSKLYIVGDGAEKGKLLQLVSELGIEDNVIFTGHMENPFYLLKLCDIFVLTSRYEGQALVILEALAVGLKVISTDIPGPDNILKQGYGELVEATEIGLSRKMISVANDNKSYKQFDPYAYDQETFERFMTILNND